MSYYFFLPIGLIIISLVAILLYKISKRRTNRLRTFIPSMLFAISIALVFIKMQFISVGYDVISDIVVIIFLAIGLGTSLLGAIVIEIMRRRKE